MELKDAIQRLTTELRNDTDYRRSWVANIAMAYKDCEGQYRRRTGKRVLNRNDRHIVANEAAEHFIKLLCDEYKYPEGE